MKWPLHTQLRNRRRSGFTLIEMLVATALVLLIMLLFASIYGAAVGTITDQRGLANNDSKARTVEAIIRRDLEKLTFRQLSTDGTRGLVPLSPGDVVDPRQQGFFYLSENDPNDPTDDVLHYTIDVTLNHRNDDDTPVFGRATNIGGSNNEPDADDGVSGNDTGMSTKAEVMVFLRGGKLYRRVQLLREPLGSGLSTASYLEQPTTTPAAPAPRIPVWRPVVGFQDYTGLTSFQNSFDYAATRIDADVDGDPMTWDTYLRFLGASSLQNGSGLDGLPISVPRYRNGFYPLAMNNPLGRPVEYDSVGNFIGRFTSAETSHIDFSYPGTPLDPRAGANFQLNSAFLLSKFDDNSTTLQPGFRQGNDLLLQNVSQFDVEVWDAGYREFDVDGSGGFNLPDDFNNNSIRDSGVWLDLGHNEGGVYSMTNYPLGDFHLLRNNVPLYGPRAAPDVSAPPSPPLEATVNRNRVFDTWHPGLGSLPPFRPMKYDPGVYFVPGTNGSWSDHFNSGAVSTNVPSCVFPDAATGNSQFVYVCVSGNGNSVGTKQPEWPRQHGAIVRENAGTANEVVWQCFDNRVGLEAIRITLRYQDPGSLAERQLTIFHSFVE